MSSSTNWSREEPPAKTRVEGYEGADQDQTFNLFAEDARRAASAGYEAVSHKFEGDTLLVTYRFRGVPRPAGAPLARLSVPALGIMVGGAFVALGAILPWVSATDPNGLSRLGLDGPDGLVAVMFGFSLLLVGRSMRRGQNLHRATWSLAASVLTLVFLSVEYVNIVPIGPPGVGLLVGSLGALIATAASVAIWLGERRTQAPS